MSKNEEKEAFIKSPFPEGPNWIPVAKWIRVRFDNKYIANSKRVLLKRGFPLYYFFPMDDVDMQMLQKNPKQVEKDSWGDCIYWKVKGKNEEKEKAAWTYENLTEVAPENLEKYIAFEWDAMDAWLEEDEEIKVHPRDPYHRIDVCHSTRHVKIEIDGMTVAETNRPVLLFETGLPVRYYIPKTDVRLDALQSTDHQTGCPYKGTAAYYSIKTPGKTMENVVWTYPFPTAETLKIKDMLAFFTEKLDEVYIDGKRLDKVKTKWS